MHIKIHRTIKDDESWVYNPRFNKTKNSEEITIVPINNISLSQLVVESPKDMIYNKTYHQAHIEFSKTETIIVSKEEYERIEKLLAFNNKKEIEILSNTYPDIKVKNIIQELQVNE